MVNTCLEVLLIKSTTPLESAELSHFSEFNTDDKLRTAMTSKRFWVKENEIVTLFLAQTIRDSFDQVCFIPDTLHVSANEVEEMKALFKASMISTIASLMGIEKLSQAILVFDHTVKLDNLTFPTDLFKNQAVDDKCFVEIKYLELEIAAVLVDYRSGGYSSRHVSFKFEIEAGLYCLANIKSEIVKILKVSETFQKMLKVMVQQLAGEYGQQLIAVD